MRIVMAGALGEVGSSVTSVLARMGHEVVRMSSRGPVLGEPEVLDVKGAIRLIREGSVDGVISAAGRGDRRQTQRTGREATSEMAVAADDAGVASVLLSTVRVLEGYDADVPGDADARPETPYAEANAENERVWLDSGGSTVIRLVNFFCPPSSPASPQIGLLPWSLVTEALAEGQIRVRSGPSSAKAFVDARDVAHACLTVLERGDRPRVCGTTPGTLLTMRDLAEAARDAVAAERGGLASLSFGPDGPAAPLVRPGWLKDAGWSARVTRDSMTAAIRSWVADQPPVAAS